MRVENHNGVGNPNHAENGQFASNGGGGSASTPNVNKNGGSNPLFKKKNMAATPSIKQPIINSEGKRTNIVKSNPAIENKPKQELKPVSNPKFTTNSNFQEAFKDFSNSSFVKMVKFVASGFNFNKLKGIKKLNDKVFTPNIEKQQENVVPQKVSNEEMQNLHKEGVELQNEAKQINAEIEHFKALRDVYANKFGNHQKMFTNFLKKSNMFRKYLIAQDKQKELKAKQEAYNQKKQDVRDRIIARNQFVKQGGMQ